MSILYLSKSIVSVVTSNSNNGDGTKILCENLKCPELTYNEQIVLDQTMNSLQKFHMKLYKQVFSIGWDIVVHCKHGKRIENYVLEGNLFHNPWNVYSYKSKMAEKFISKFKTTPFKKISLVFMII